MTLSDAEEDQPSQNQRVNQDQNLLNTASGEANEENFNFSQL